MPQASFLVNNNHKKPRRSYNGHERDRGLVAAWCAALPYPAEDLVGTANDAWAVPQTFSQTALGASVAASLSTAAPTMPRRRCRGGDASLAAAATT